MTEITVSYPVDQKHFYFVKSQDHKFLILSILQDAGINKKNLNRIIVLKTREPVLRKRRTRCSLLFRFLSTSFTDNIKHKENIKK